MRSHALTIIIDSDRDIPDVTRLAADMARLAALEPDVDVTSIQIYTWHDDDDGDCEHHDLPVDAVTFEDR